MAARRRYLVEDRREVAAELRVEKRDDVLGHDRLVLEALVDVRAAASPTAHSSSTTLRSVLRKSAPLKYMSCVGWRWMRACCDDGLLVLTFGFSPLRT